jgi:hypothetical protein
MQLLGVNDIKDLHAGCVRLRGGEP